ncbi:MAG: DUF2062 domain-containing protein, partial [Kiloniellales bacterium]|nr:DUF2062 domain-containing protein [Kiloniellales bacterium]
IASAVGTAAGNPWTFPFIWLWIYEFGRWILGIENGYMVLDQEGFSDIFGMLLSSFWSLALEGQLPDGVSAQRLWNSLLTVLWPMVVGGLPTAVTVWFLAFFPIRSMIRRYQRRRRRILLRRMRRKRFRERLKSFRGVKAETDENSPDGQVSERSPPINGAVQDGTESKGASLDRKLAGLREAER